MKRLGGPRALYRLTEQHPLSPQVQPSARGRSLVSTKAINTSALKRKDPEDFVYNWAPAYMWLLEHGPGETQSGPFAFPRRQRLVPLSLPRRPDSQLAQDFTESLSLHPTLYAPVVEIL